MGKALIQWVWRGDHLPSKPPHRHLNLWAQSVVVGSFRSEFLAAAITLCSCRIVTAICVVLLVASLAPPWADAAAAKKRGGTISVGLETDLPGFDPLTAHGLGLSGSTALNLVAERLFDIDAQGRLIPVLGLDAEPSDDRRAWTIKLRKGVVFHDGSPFNADAVVHHWKRILDPANRFRGRVLLRAIKAVRRVDDHSVRFELRDPWASFLNAISSIRFIAAYVPSPKSVDAGTYDRAPVGTGPFMFKEWKSGDRFVVVRNPNYWQQGKPYLDRVVFRFLPDPQTRYASLKSGQIDVMWTDRGNVILKATKDKSLVTYDKQEPGATVLMLNNTKPPLDDVRVRRALAHAWNQDFFVKMATRGTVPLVHDPFGNSMSCEDVGYRKHDINRAKALLKEYGKPVELQIDHTSTPRGRAFAEITQNLFKRIGVVVKPVPADYLQLRKRVITNEYQMSGYVIRGNQDMAPMLSVLFSSTSLLNLTRYKSPEMDRLLMKQRVESDPARRQAHLCSIARLLNKDVPIIYAGGIRHYLFARPEVKGIDSIDLGIARLSWVWLDR